MSARVEYTAADRRRQVEWEISEALFAARKLVARLEMLGNHPVAVRAVNAIRHDLSDELIRLDEAETPSGGGPVR